MVSQRRERRGRRRERKNIPHGRAYIQSTFNNTIITMTDLNGNPVAWSSAGSTAGVRGSRKGTPFAAQIAAEEAAKKAAVHGMKEVDVYVKGPGSGRESAVPRPPGRRPHPALDPRRDANPAQRLPPAQASPRLARRPAPRHAGQRCATAGLSGPESTKIDQNRPPPTANRETRPWLDTPAPFVASAAAAARN